MENLCSIWWRSNEIELVFAICRRSFDLVFRLLQEVINFSLSILIGDFGTEFKGMNSSYIAGHKWLGILQVFVYCFVLFFHFSVGN